MPGTFVFYWQLTAVIGSVGFVISSFLLLLEVQHHWWEPRPFDIGWQGTQHSEHVAPLTTSRIVERYRFRGLPPLCSLWLLFISRDEVPIRTLDVLGQLRIPLGQRVPAVGNRDARAPAQEQQDWVGVVKGISEALAFWCGAQ